MTSYEKNRGGGQTGLTLSQTDSQQTEDKFAALCSPDVLYVDNLAVFSR